MTKMSCYPFFNTLIKYLYDSSQFFFPPSVLLIFELLDAAKEFIALPSREATLAHVISLTISSTPVEKILID